MCECLDYTDIHNSMEYILCQKKKSGSDKSEPYVLLVYGPPGSGKSSSAINFALDNFNLENDYMSISIDTIIDSTCEHQNQIKEIDRDCISNLGKNINKDNDIKNIIKNRRIIKNKVYYFIKIFASIALLKKKECLYRNYGT